MAKQPKEEPNPILQHLFNTPIKYGLENPGFDIPTYRDVSDDFDTFEGSRVDPLGGVNFEAEDDWLAKRDAEQSLYDAWGNGLIKAVGKAGTTAVEGIGALATLPFGLIKGVSSGDWSGFYDNALGNAMDDINDSLAEAFPNYSSRRDSTFDADFWADQFLGGAGYMAGAILGGEGIGLIGKAVGGGLKATSLLQLGKGSKIKDIVGSGSKLAQFGAKLKDPTKQLAYSLATATSEAAVEARDVKNVLYDDLFARRDAGDLALQGKTDAELMDMSRAAGNAAFAFNLPVIAASNFLTFGKALTSKYGAARKTFGNVVGDIGETAVKKESALLSGLGRLGEGAISEGSQELAQLGISEGSKKYYLGQYSSSAQHFNSLWGSVIDETVRNLGTKEGFESMFLGAILGGPTSLLVGQKQRAQEKKNTAAYSELLNNPMLQSLVSNLSRRGDNITQVANASAQQDGAIVAGDKFGFKNSEYDVLKGLTKQAVELGGADTFIDKLEALKESDLGEFNKKFSNPEGEFATVEERNKSIDDAIQTVKSVADAYDNIIVSRPELNPLVAEKTPELTQAKRHIFDAVFDAVTNFEDIDKRENDITSQILGLTAGQKITNIGIIPSEVGPILNQYIENTPGVDFDTFRKSDAYKENFQSKIDDFKKVNPAKASEVQTLVDDLIKLSLRREEMIKQYNEAIEQPEKIQKEAEAAAQKLQEKRDRLKAEADAQAAEALKTATEATPQPTVNTPQPAQTPEQMLGGTTEDGLQMSASENESELEKVAIEIATLQEDLKSYEPGSDMYSLYEAALQEAEAKQKALISKKKETEEANKKKEGTAEKQAVATKTISSEDKEPVDGNTFTKLISPKTEAAQKIIQTTPVQELIKGIKVIIKEYSNYRITSKYLLEGSPIVINGRRVDSYTVDKNIDGSIGGIDVKFADTSTLDYTTAEAQKDLNKTYIVSKEGGIYEVGTETPVLVQKATQKENVSYVGRPISITFTYNGVELGYLPNADKFRTKDGRGWNDLNTDEKLNLFKARKGTLTLQDIQALNIQQQELAKIQQQLEKQPFGEYSLQDFPFLSITPSMGEFDIASKDTEPLLATKMPIARSGGNPLIYDQNKGTFVYSNDTPTALDAVKTIPEGIQQKPGEKNKVGNRYLVLLENGNWAVLEHKELTLAEFETVFKELLDLQKRIKEGEKVDNDTLNEINDKVQQAYYVAQGEPTKDYLVARLSTKGTFTIRNINYTTGKESGKPIKSGIQKIETVYNTLSKEGTIKGNEESLRLKVGFKNSGLKVNYNNAIPEAAQPKEAVTSVEVEDKIAELRAKEEVEVKKIIPNIDDYKVGGVINKDKVLEGIEERKKAELKKAESTTTEIVEETEPNGKKVFLGTPSKDGYFINKNVKTKFDEEENVYEFILTSDTTAKFKVHSHPEAVKSALKFPDKTIDTVSTSLNGFTPSANGIRTVKYGEAVLEGDKWVVKNKAEIEYTGGNTKPAQATSGTSVEATKAVEAKYKAQADAYNEIYDRYDKLITGAAKGTSTETKATVTIPILTTVKVDLASLSIDELNNVAKQLRQKAVDARQAEKEGKTVLGGSVSVESDYQAVKKYIAELAALETKTEEIISTTPEQLKKDVAALLNKALQELKEANATGKNFILGFHGGRTFDKADRTKQYTGEFRDPEVKRVAESAGARYEGEMLFFTEDLSEEGNKFTYETAIRSATAYAIKYGDDAPSIQAYLIPLNETQFANKGLGEVGVTYDDIEADRIRKIGSVDFTRKIVTKDTTEAPVTEQPTSVRERRKNKSNEINNDINAEGPFKVSELPAETKIKFEEALAYLRSILPFEVGDIDAIADRLTNNGITFGAFIDNVIYLNKAAEAGTEYHEAFHGVMSLFSTEERAKYLEVAKKEHKITDKARAEFVLQRPVYQNLSKEALDKVMLEEYLADKFMAWKQGKKEPNGFFAKMFDKIKKFFDGIKDYFGGNLDSLFHRIDSGKYKHRTIGGNKLPMFMALPYNTEKIKGTDEKIIKKLNSTEESDLINTIRVEVGELITESLASKDVYTIKQAFDKVLEMRDNLYLDKADELSEEEGDEYYQKNSGLFKITGVKEAVFEKVKSQIQFLLSVDEEIAERILSKEEEEDLRNYEASALQNTGISSMTQYVRILIATAHINAIDKYGVPYKKGINPSTIYNSISRTLLNTAPENFMRKLEIFSEYNPEVKIFTDYLKDKLNWNNETNNPGLNNDGELKNEHIWNAFKKAFHKFKVESMMTRLSSNGETKVSSSNAKDVDTQQIERWQIGYRNFIEKNFTKLNIADFIYFNATSPITDEQLEEESKKAKATLDSIGIKLSPLYLQYSLLVTKKERTDKQQELMDLYENFYGLNGSDGKFLKELITDFINTGLNPFTKGDEGMMARLKALAMENASFDETAGSSTFQAADGELRGDTSLGSFFLKRVAQLQKPEARAEDLEEFTRFYANQEDEWMIPLHHLATLDNPLYEHAETFDKKFVFTNIDGIRATEYDEQGNEINKQEGTVFKNMVPLEKLLTFMSLYSTTKVKTTKEGKKINYAYYYPQVIEAASTGYAILLPVKPYYDKGYKPAFYQALLSFVKNEHARIKYVQENKDLPSIRNFNVGEKNGLKFFENSWISPELSEKLIALNSVDEMSVELKKELKDNIDQFVQQDYLLTVDTLVREGAIIEVEGEFYTRLLPEAFRTDKKITKDEKTYQKVNTEKIRSMQANYLINGQAFNTLLHGDLAYKIKSPEDHVKRLKGAHGALTSLYGRQIKFKVIPDIKKDKRKIVVDGLPKFVEVTEAEKAEAREKIIAGNPNLSEKEIVKKIKEKLELDEHNLADAQAYTTLDFQIARLKELGKTSPAIVKILEKVRNGVEITRKELELLEGADSLLNPKKDLAYALNANLKMSVLTLTRELVSYKSKGEWLAIPGREKEHKILNDMVKNTIDLVAHESASKGTTIIDEVRTLNGEYYGEQVLTKGVKQKITDGTQQLALIWSELPQELESLVEKLDEAEQNRVIQSTEFALSLLKEKDETTLKKVLPNWYNSLVSTGASPQLLEIFKPNAAGEPTLNPNISISVAKFTAMYLAHWSNHALKQKVAGSKFTLVTPFNVMVDKDDNVVRVDQFKSGAKYTKPRPLAYNKRGKLNGREIVYSECIVSAYYKELYNLKEGDEIPEDLAYMMGYRIPTEDKASMGVLKVVDFLPAIYGNAIMIPEELQYLSGADFDIDSLFVQKYDIYEKDGKFYKYGSATTTEGQFEEFLNYVKDETDVVDYQKTLLEANEEYQDLLKQEKELQKLIEARNENIAELDEKLREANDFIPLSLYEESEKEITRSWVLPAKSKEIAEQKSLIEQAKEIQQRKQEIKANKLASALRYYELPASKTAWAAAVKEGKYPDGKFKAVLNNDLLTYKLEMLGNEKVQNTLASEKTSNEPLLKLQETLAMQFPATFDSGKQSLGFFSFNDLAVAMANNDAGSDGIGPAAVFNVLYQYLAKQGVGIKDAQRFAIKEGFTVRKYYQFKGFSFKKDGVYRNAENKRIVKTISAIISAMTDNAKEPIAAKLNLNLETLGPVLVMLGTGVKLSTAIKIANSPKVKQLSQEILQSKSNFSDVSAYSIVQNAKAEVADVDFTQETTVLDEELLDLLLKDGEDIGTTSDIALKLYLNAREISEDILKGRDILSLRKGVPATFGEVDKIITSLNKLRDGKTPATLGLSRLLDVKPIEALTKALEDLNSVAQQLFTMQHPYIKETFNVVKQEVKRSESKDVSNKIYSDLSSFMSLSIFRKYLEDYVPSKKNEVKFIETFKEVFTEDVLFEKTLLEEVEDLKKNAKKYNLQNNRFLKYLSTESRLIKRTVDKIEGNTRQLRDSDYQLELINGFDDLYANPLTRKTAVKLFAYILLKDGARYRNASFQSEIPSYMFKIYSNALDAFRSNPSMVDVVKLGNEFIKLYSLNLDNRKSLYKISKSNPLLGKGKKDGSFKEEAGQVAISRIENSVFPEIAAAYNFEYNSKDDVYKPVPFLMVGNNLKVISEINGKAVTNLSDLREGDNFVYKAAKDVFGIYSLTPSKRGISGYSFPLEKAIDLFGAKVTEAKEEEEAESSAGISLEEFLQANNYSDFKEPAPAERIVTEAEYKEIKAAEPVTPPTVKAAPKVTSVSEQLKEWGVTFIEGVDPSGLFPMTKVEFNKNTDQRVKDIVNRNLDSGILSQSAILADILKAGKTETLKKAIEC